MIWRPTNVTQTPKFESIQKWTLSEINKDYSSWNKYVIKCKVDLFPMSERYNFNDLLFLHNVIYYFLIPINLPENILDSKYHIYNSLSLVSSIIPKSQNRAFLNSLSIKHTWKNILREANTEGDHSFNNESLPKPFLMNWKMGGFSVWPSFLNDPSFSFSHRAQPLTYHKLTQR